MGRRYFFLLLNQVKYLEEQSKFWVHPSSVISDFGQASQSWIPECVRMLSLGERIPRVKTKEFLVGLGNECHINMPFPCC